jgi:hypothetical protein
MKTVSHVHTNEKEKVCPDRANDPNGPHRMLGGAGSKPFKQLAASYGTQTYRRSREQLLL